MKRIENLLLGYNLRGVRSVELPGVCSKACGLCLAGALPLAPAGEGFEPSGADCPSPGLHGSVEVIVGVLDCLRAGSPWGHLRASPPAGRICIPSTRRQSFKKRRLQLPAPRLPYHSLCQGAHARSRNRHRALVGPVHLLQGKPASQKIKTLPCYCKSSQPRQLASGSAA